MKSGALGRHADVEGENRREREEAPLAAPAANAATGERRGAHEPQEAGPHGARLDRRIDPRHRHRHDSEGQQGARDGERLEAGRPERPQHHLPGGGAPKLAIW